MIRGIRQSLAKAAARDTEPVRRLCAWMLDREHSMAQEEREVLRWAMDAIVSAEDSFAGDDVW